MSKTYIADKDTLDAVNGKIGTKDDAPSPNPISLFAGIKQLLKGLSDHMASWTGDRAVKVDYLDTTVGSRAPANTALSTAQWTNVRAGYLDKLNNSSYGLEAIKNTVDKKDIGSAIKVTVSELDSSNNIFSGTGKGVLFINSGGANVMIDGRSIGSFSGLITGAGIFLEFSSNFEVSKYSSSYKTYCGAVFY